MIWNIANQIVKGLPGLGKFSALRNPVEQACAHLALEITDLQAERRLADPNTFCGTSEVLFGRNREEVTNVA